MRHSIGEGIKGALERGTNTALELVEGVGEKVSSLTVPLCAVPLPPPPAEHMYNNGLLDGILNGKQGHNSLRHTFLPSLLLLAFRV
jgi:hypothetical protein